MHDEYSYFARRAEQEERLAASSTHRGVRATHERFAAEFKAKAAIAMGNANAQASADSA